MTFDYDLFVIGAGSGGVSAARLVATHGVKVAIAERDKVGGTCVIHGCIPKKLMVYAASFSYVFEDTDECGWGKVQRRVSWQQFMPIQHLNEAGVELIYGQTKFWRC